MVVVLQDHGSRRLVDPTPDGKGGDGSGYQYYLYESVFIQKVSDLRLAIDEEKEEKRSTRALKSSKQRYHSVKKEGVTKEGRASCLLVCQYLNGKNEPKDSVNHCSPLN